MRAGADALDGHLGGTDPNGNVGGTDPTTHPEDNAQSGLVSRSSEAPLSDPPTAPAVGPSGAAQRSPWGGVQAAGAAVLAAPHQPATPTHDVALDPAVCGPLAALIKGPASPPVVAVDGTVALWVGSVAFLPRGSVDRSLWARGVLPCLRSLSVVDFGVTTLLGWAELRLLWHVPFISFANNVITSLDPLLGISPMAAAPPFVVPNFASAAAFDLPRPQSSYSGTCTPPLAQTQIPPAAPPGTGAGDAAAPGSGADAPRGQAHESPVAPAMLRSEMAQMSALLRVRPRRH